MWIGSLDGEWYVHEIRGVCFVSFVPMKDKGHALVFPKENIREWVHIMSELTGRPLQAIPCK